MITNKEKNFVSAVIYVYNNENEIKEICKKINNVLKQNFEKYEIICVNDASTDNSLRKIEDFAQELEDEVLNVINMSYYQGTENAMNAGVDLAIGDFVYEFDNILNDYDSKTIMDIYYKSLEGFDIVSAISKNNKHRISSTFYKVFNSFSNMEYKLQTENFRILSRRAINRIHSISKDIPYRKAIYANCGLKMYHLVYDSKSTIRRNTNRKVNQNKIETAVNSLILFTNIGYKFASFMSILMIMITVLVAIYTSVIFISNNPVQGWTTTMLFLSFCFCGLFIIMTIIIKYLEILLKLTFRKNTYMIESINKLN